MKNMTIGKKVAATCGILTALSVLLGLVLFINISNIGSNAHAVADVSVPVTNALGKLISTAKDQKLLMLTHVISTSREQMTQLESQIADQDTQLQAVSSELAKLPLTESNREAVAKFNAAHVQLMAAWAKMQPLSEAGKAQSAIAIWTTQGIAASKAQGEAVGSTIERAQVDASDRANSMVATASNSRLWCVLALAMSLVGGGGVAFFVVRSINEGLNEAVRGLSNGAEQVSGAAIQISSSSQSLAKGTSEQAASLEETSASSEEMTSMTRKNADNSEQCAKLMVQVDGRVVTANQTLGQMVTSMKEINSSSDKISKIIRVIDEIAFQTNILALNAAVEAARAGEAGMGFAVVADEVRNLAQRSAQAAKDTAALIEESISRSNEGSTKLTQVAEAISSITASANQVKTLVDEVNLGSQEQARGVEQISKAIVQIEQVTQRAAASSEEAASASEELAAQSQAIHVIIQQLQAMVNGSGAHTAAVRVPLNGKREPRAINRARTPVKTVVKGAVRMGGTVSPVSAGARKPEAKPEPALSVLDRPERNPIPMDDDFLEF